MTIEPLQQRAPRRKLTAARIDLDAICRLLSVWTYEKWDDQNIDSFCPPPRAVCEELHRQGVDEPSDEQVDELSQKWEMAERDEAWTNYRDAVMSVADEVFGEHGLKLVPMPPRTRTPHYRRIRKGWEPGSAWDFQIEPVESWTDAAGKVLSTLNGAGPFYWANVKRFIAEASPGPHFTAREVVLHHLGWIPDWYKVYGNGTASSAVDRRARR